MWDRLKGLSKKDITIRKVASHMENRDIKLVYIWEIKNQFGIDIILKWEIVKDVGKKGRG